MRALRAVSDTRAIVSAFADALERRDWPAFAALLDADVVYEIPQTRERIRGRDTYVRFNAEFPGDWHIRPKVVLADDHDGSLLFEWTSDRENDGEPALAIAFFEFGDAPARLITRITDFWPEPYEPPSGREHLVDRW